MMLEVVLKSNTVQYFGGTSLDPIHFRPGDLDLGIKSCVCTSFNRKCTQL